MDLGWPHRTCILCTRSLSPELPFSRAHLIPESIGGFAWAWSKCKECNEDAGSSIEAAVVADDSIRFAVDALRAQLPALASKFDERTRWVAKAEDGATLEARQRDGEFELLTTKDPDGSRRQGTEQARAGLVKRLEREGRAATEIEAALMLFDNAPKGEPVVLHGETFIQGETATDFGLPFNGTPVADAFPSLIAFHFLALALGEQAFDPRLDPLREAIRRGDDRSKWHAAESMITRQYEPMHLVGFAQCQPHVVVRVQLFGWNVWRVHFPRIASASEPIGLRFDLTDKTVGVARPRLDRPLEPPSRP